MKPILVPTDFSDAAFQAARYALRLARDTGAELHLLNVFHLPNPLQVLPIELIVTTDELKSDTESALKQLVKELQKSEGSDVTVKIASRNGDTQKEIDAYAEFIGAGLIVTGKKGRSAVRETIIGNTSLALLRHSRYPVLSIPASTDYRYPERMLLATDGAAQPGATSVELLRTLLQKRTDGLHLGCILPPHEPEDREAIADTVNPALEGLNVTWHFQTADDEIKALEGLALQLQADWLIVLPHQHSLLGRIFQSDHTRELAFHAGMPVLALRSS